MNEPKLAPPERRRLWPLVQKFLLVALVLTALRLGLIYRARHEEAKPREVATAPAYNLTADDYVVLPRSYAYDIPSARKELAHKQVWVRAVNQLAVYPYAPASQKAELNRPLGVLPPLERLEIRDFVLQRRGTGDYQVLAVFARADGSVRAAPVGAANAATSTLYLNECFFLRDPHELFAHWPAATWAAIDRHQVEPGMSESQAVMAVGAGVPQGSGKVGDRTIEFGNDGHPLIVTFARGHATKVVPKT